MFCAAPFCGSYFSAASLGNVEPTVFDQSRAASWLTQISRSCSKPFKFLSDSEKGTQSIMA